MYIEDENVHSNADFRQLQRECHMIFTRLILAPDTHIYPNIKIMADEYKSYIASVNIDEYAKNEFLYGNKIHFIKFIRDRYNGMSLLDAKMMADGYWERFKSQGYSPRFASV